MNFPLEKLCNVLFPRTNKTVCNDGGGGGGIGTGKLIFVTPWTTIFHFGVRESSCTAKLFCASLSKSTPWKVNCQNPQLCTRSIEENKSLIWPNDLNRTIARWRYLTTESFDVTLHTQHVVEMKCQYLLHHFSCRCLLARLLFVNLWRNPPPSSCTPLIKRCPY